MAKEYRYRNAQRLSSNNYVPSILKIEGDRYQLRIVWLHYHCDHQTTVCPTIKCVRSWMQDNRLLFDCTNGGRRLAAAVGIDPNISQPDVVGQVVV